MRNHEPTIVLLAACAAALCSCGTSSDSTGPGTSTGGAEAGTTGGAGGTGAGDGGASGASGASGGASGASGASGGAAGSAGLGGAAAGGAGGSTGGAAGNGGTGGAPGTGGQDADAGSEPDAASSGGGGATDGSAPTGCDAITPPAGFTIAWCDEFDGPNGSAPESTSWNYDVGYGPEDDGWGNGELQYYTDTRENSYVKDGVLVIEARTDNAASTSCGGGPCQYTSARLTTLGKRETLYGRVEARIKIPAGSGMWPAFWMMGNDYGNDNWPTCGEIDVMEVWGADPSVVVGTTHDPGGTADYQDNGLPGEYTLASGAAADDFHVYAIEWDQDSVRFFFDEAGYHCVRKASAPDSVCGSVPATAMPADGTWVFAHPFFVLLNLAIDGTAGDRPDESTVFPAKMLVDYVRFYAKS